MIVSFASWYEDRRATNDMQWQIIKDKLAQGVNGIEWLVLNYSPKEYKITGLNYWFECFQEEGIFEIEDVMKAALIMDSESFHKKYECNWWMAVSYTLTYLFLLKRHNYDRYFNFLRDMERK